MLHYEHNSELTAPTLSLPSSPPVQLAEITRIATSFASLVRFLSKQMLLKVHSTCLWQIFRLYYCQR